MEKDDRFRHIQTDPRFRSMPKKDKKIKIDKRFKGMFQEKNFKLKYSVDKRGRPVQSTTNENLRKFYQLSDDDHDDDDNEDDMDSKSIKSLKIKSNLVKKKNEHESKHDIVKRKLKKEIISQSKSDKTTKITKESDEEDEKSNNEDNDEDDGSDENVGSDEESDADLEEEKDRDHSSSDEDETFEFKVGAGVPDYARGECILDSSDEDSSDDDEEEENEDDKLEHDWGEMDKHVARTADVTHRIAVCNMDWDRTEAKDIFILLNSFKPANGIINRVRVYPSEFGLQRLKEEESQGPTELKKFAKEVNCSDDESSDENVKNEGLEYHREKLRIYQLNRLKYYYCVVECDSIQTASKIYEECDGLEYESTCSRLDLRFIPEDMTFDSKVESECTSLPDTTLYKVPTFTTSALGQSKVDLTWDETHHDRIKLTMQKFDKKNDYNADDFKAYLASDSDEDVNVNYKQMIASSDEESDEDFNEEAHIEKYKNLLKEIDESSSQKNDMEMEISWEPGLKDATENIVKTKEKEKSQSSWDSYLDKKKLKKKQRKDELKSKNKGGDEKAFSDDDLPCDVDMADITRELGVTKSSNKKKKRRGKEKKTEEEVEEEKKKAAELELLLMDEEDGKQHFKLEDLVTKKKKKSKISKQKSISNLNNDNFEVDVKDNRFNAIYQSHLFNIDPSAPEFKKTKGMEALINEKLKRRIPDSFPINVESKVRKVDESFDQMSPAEHSLSSLVRSLKNKTEKYHTGKNIKKRKV